MKFIRIRVLYCDDLTKFFIIFKSKLMFEEETSEDSATRTTTDAEGSTVTMEYSSDFRSLVKLTDGNGNIYRNSYNNDSNLNETIYPDGLRQSYTYDNEGNLVSRKSRSSKEIQYAFNTKDKLVQKSHVDKNGGNAISTSYEYFENGLLKKATSKDSTVEFTYTSKKLPLTVTYDRKTTLHYKYNAKGQRVSLADSSGQYNVTYHYDVNGRMIEVKQNGKQNLLQIEYKNGAIKNKKTGDNTLVSMKYSTKTNSLEEMEIKRNSGSQKFVYSHDNFGRKNKIVETMGSLRRVWALAYDRMSQLVSYGDGRRVENEIVYDSNWNRKLVTNKQDNTEYHYVTNSMNQLTGLNEDEKLSYDDDGNLVRVENLKKQVDQRFQYSGQHEKLTAFTGSKGQRCTYVYDALDNIKQETCDGVVKAFLVDPFAVSGPTVIGEVNLAYRFIYVFFS